MAGRKVTPLVALTSFTVALRDGEVFVKSGDVLPSNSPVVKGRKQLFVAQADYVQREGALPTP